jgi:hypothetical protein
MKQLLLVLVLTVFPVLAQSATYYVAQSGGNDSNPGSQSAPFQTIQKCANIAVAGDTCLIRSGTYRETIIPSHSGSTSAPITFQPDSGANVTINGTDIVTGWSVSSGAIYRANAVSWNLGNSNGMNQAFVDGQPMILARWPNTGPDLMHPTWGHTDGGGNDNGVYYTVSDAPQPSGFWNGGVIITHGETGYYTEAFPIISYDTRRIVFDV